MFRVHTWIGCTLLSCQFLAIPTQANNLNERFIASQQFADPELTEVISRIASEARTRLANSGLVEAIKESSPAVDLIAGENAAIQLAMSAKKAAMESNPRPEPGKLLELLADYNKLATDQQEVYQRLRNAKTNYEIRIRTLLERQWDDQTTGANGKEMPAPTTTSGLEPATIAQVQSGLRADEALILFSGTVGNPQSHQLPIAVWFVTNDQVRERKTEATLQSIRQRVELLRCGLDETAWYAGSDDRSYQAARAANCRTAFPHGLTPVNGQIVLPFDLDIAHQLYRDLLGMEEKLITGKKLFIVGFGPLNSLPFQVLVTSPPESSGRPLPWLIRSHQIVTLPTVNWLIETRSQSGLGIATRPYLAFANPPLNGPDKGFQDESSLSRDLYSCDRVIEFSDRINRRRGKLLAAKRSSNGALKVADLMGLVPLPETAYEVCAAGNFLGAYPDEIIIGGSASEQTFDAARFDLLRYKILHFATHGLPADSFIRDRAPGLVLNPKGCGGCQHGEEPAEYKASGYGWPSLETEGFLSATEIASIPLDADLVILSACNTASPDNTKQEAFSGLARAFLAAGARSVLGSHWEVNSRITVKLITRFVSLTSNENRSLAEALQRAMLELTDTPDAYYSHPSYWAPFVLIGGTELFAPNQFALLADPPNEERGPVSTPAVPSTDKGKIDRHAISNAATAGTEFRDCEGCPAMVVVPSGSFTMGSPSEEELRSDNEGPQRRVHIGHQFAVGKFEVKAAEWQACVADGGCKPNGAFPYYEKFANRPAVNVSWNEVIEFYLPWINRKLSLSGANAYRLLTEAEWEYVARAGTSTPFHTGSEITTDQANFDGDSTYGGSTKGIQRWRAVDVGSFSPNPFGIHDLHGNVNEWVQDCFNNSYAGLATDGSSAPEVADCERTIRGGNWADYAFYLRSAQRNSFHPTLSGEYTGFRLARTLPAP